MSIPKAYLSYIKSNLLHPRTLKFSIVGGSGVAVNMLVLYLLTDVFRFHYVASSIIAIEISIISNFLLNSIWTWNDRKTRGFFQKLLQYHITVGMTAILSNFILLIVLTEVFNVHYLFSNLIGIGLGALANFIINDLWTFKQQE